jgi:hypothetical protein
VILMQKFLETSPSGIDPVSFGGTGEQDRLVLHW